MSDKILTVIITLRSAGHYDMVARLRYRVLDTKIPETVCFLVIDDSSPSNDAEEIQRTCRELGFEYRRYESEKAVFCASTARNFGAMAARTPYIIHEDVDLFPYPGFYNDLIAEISIQKLDAHSDRFLTVPVLYLSEEATARAVNGAISKNELLHAHLTASEDVSSNFPASSVILANRFYYLSIGGYNEKFYGWGLEDLEYAYRLTRAQNQFMTPKDTSFLVERGFSTHPVYRGWRSQFRLHGELLSRKGICLFHAYHPKDPAWRNPSSHSLNKEIFTAEISRFDREGHYLPSLPAPEFGKSLIFGRGTFAYNRALMPLWGELEIKDYEFFQKADIVEYCKGNGINRVIFTNPYASETRLRVYEAVRQANIPFVVVERGALPDSMFIDDTGFCCESTRYRRLHWPTELSEARRKRAAEYISQLSSSSSSLERQGERIGRRAALEKLGVPPSKKVLFVPFQSRSDTTVKFFAGPIGSFDNFVSLVRDVTNRLSDDWIVVFKNHPLSDVREDVPGAVNIGDLHINDALEVADYVLLMNSGVGVLAAVFGKPVIHTGIAFYADDGLNRSARTASEVLDILASDFQIDHEARYRFVSYLIEDFYSFGEFSVKERRHTNNARLTITDRIDYYLVNFLGRRIVSLQKGERIVSDEAPVYDIFRHWIRSKKYDESPPEGRRMVKIVRPFVARLGTKRDLREFSSNPSAFFAKLSSPLYRNIGAILFPPQNKRPVLKR